jgi:hypothetical protein
MIVWDETTETKAEGLDFSSWKRIYARLERPEDSEYEFVYVTYRRKKFNVHTDSD